MNAAATGGFIAIAMTSDARYAPTASAKSKEEKCAEREEGKEEERGRKEGGKEEGGRGRGGAGGASASGLAWNEMIIELEVDCGSEYVVEL